MQKLNFWVYDLNQRTNQMMNQPIITKCCEQVTIKLDIGSKGLSSQLIFAQAVDKLGSVKGKLHLVKYEGGWCCFSTTGYIKLQGAWPNLSNCSIVNLPIYYAGSQQKHWSVDLNKRVTGF